MNHLLDEMPHQKQTVVIVVFVVLFLLHCKSGSTTEQTYQIGMVIQLKNSALMHCVTSKMWMNVLLCFVKKIMVFTFFHTEYYHVFSVLFLLHRDKLIAIDSDLFLFSYLGQTSKWFQFLTTSWSPKKFGSW